MENWRTLIMLFIAGLIMASCSDFLDVPPKGSVNEEAFDNPKYVEKLVNAAYASLGNDTYRVPYSSMYPYGSFRSDDSYKGGLGTADNAGYHYYEVFSLIRVDQPKTNDLWRRLYIGIQRANLALKKIKKIDESDYTLKKQREAEMRFLRGHFHFLLKISFKRIPYIDESIPTDSLKSISNVQYSNNELWNKIAEDFQFAIDNLPQIVKDVGRPNKLVAKAYLAKLRLYQAYEQDKQNNVININSKRLQEVVDLTTDVINSGQYGLFDDYAKNFLWSFENGKESLFAVQRSLDDGTTRGRIDVANSINFPMYDAYGCCSFHRPSQNLVNAFRTDPDGLPKFDTYNDVNMNKEQDFKNHTFDPRLDHTAGIPGHPYKYQNNIIYNVTDFTRGPEIYGPFSAMKEVQPVDCPCLTSTKQASPKPATSKNNDIIRFDDVLLWKAEALIELGRQNEALPIINQIRKRAKNSKDRLIDKNGNYYSNYNIKPYIDGQSINWTQENARRALRWERRLEFGMESSRFFDLVRWGIAAETLNKYFEEEQDITPHLSAAHFTKNKDEYFPIPQQQIDFSDGTYEQNYGWK